MRMREAGVEMTTTLGRKERGLAALHPLFSLLFVARITIFGQLQPFSTELELRRVEKIASRAQCRPCSDLLYYILDTSP